MKTSYASGDGGNHSSVGSAKNVPGSFDNASYHWAPSGDLFLNNTTATFSNYTNSNRDGVPSTADGGMTWVWASLFLLMCFCSAKPNIPDASHRTALIGWEQEQQREQIKKDPERRKQIVASNLITKRVISCDENKTLCLGDISGSVSLEESSFSLNSTEDDNVSECVICLDSFQRGDYVTWSKSMECLHVFHQECLESWLTNPKHDDCPSCRCQIIHDDGDDLKSIRDDDDEERSSGRLAFVIMNGLISPLRRARNSIVGSSICVNDQLDDDSNNNYAPLSLRRVLSLGASEVDGRVMERRSSSSLVGTALRRVSSGIYSRLSSTVDSHDDFNDEETPAIPNLSEPHELRRTRSEGLPTTPKIRNSSSYQVLGRSTLDTDLHLDLELDESNSSDYDPSEIPTRARGIMRLGFRRPKYSKLAFEPNASFREDYSDDEESLEPQILWRDEVDDGTDLEMGVIEMSSTK